MPAFMAALLQATGPEKVRQAQGAEYMPSSILTPFPAPASPSHHSVPIFLLPLCLFIFSGAPFSSWSHQKSTIHYSTPPWWGVRNCFLWGPLTVSHSLRGLYPLGYIMAGWIIWIGEKQDGNREKQSCSSRPHADLEILTPAPSSLLSQSVSWRVNLSPHLYSGELQKL